MLVISRRVDETFSIGDDIRITVVRVTANGNVRIGIDAPSHMRVIRDDAINTEPKPRPSTETLRKE